MTDLLGTWTTPGGNPASYTFRDDSSDWNTLNSIHASDEYALPTGLSGWAIDVGGYLGGVAIALALDNPDLRVLCIEPIPDNLRLIRENVARNDLTDRVEVIDGAAGADPHVVYNGRGTDSAQHHRFVGNASWFTGMDVDSVIAQCWSLTGLMEHVGAERLAFLKIDCEGCEFSFLADSAISRVERIIGEWHPHAGTLTELVDLLLPTHHVTTTGEAFTAALR